MNITGIEVTIDLFWVLYMLGAAIVVTARIERVSAIKAMFFGCGLNRYDYMTIPFIILFWWGLVFWWGIPKGKQPAPVDHES